MKASTRVLVATVRPSVRVAPLGSAAATAALAALPAWLTVVRGGTDLHGATVLLALGTGAGLAWAVGDVTVDPPPSMPVSLPARSLIRIAAVAAVGSLVCALTCGLIALGPGLPSDLAGRVPEGAAAAAVALAVAFGTSRRGDPNAGASGLMGGLIVSAAVAGLSVRWPRVFPTFVEGPVHDRWWLLVMVGLVIAVRSGRDPAAR